MIIENHKINRHYKTCRGTFEIVEKLLWVPLDAFQFLQDVRERHEG